jgi:hypothetical protein
MKQKENLKVIRKQIGILRLAMLVTVTFSCGLAIGGVIPEHIILIFAPIIIICLMIYDDLHQKYVKGLWKQANYEKRELERLMNQQ